MQGNERIAPKGIRDLKRGDDVDHTYRVLYCFALFCFVLSCFVLSWLALACLVLSHLKYDLSDFFSRFFIYLCRSGTLTHSKIREFLNPYKKRISVKGY